LLNNLDKNKKAEVLLYKSNVLSGLGYVSYLNYHYKNAIYRLEESLKIKKQINKNEDEKYLLFYLSLCYYGLGDYKSSTDYLYKALERIKLAKNNNEDDTQLEANIYYSLGKTYLKLERYTKTVEFFQSSVLISEQNNHKYLKILAQNSLAYAYIKQNEFKKAEKQLKQVQETSKQTNNFGIAENYALIALVKIEFSQIDSAKYYLNKAENIALENNDIYDLTLVYKNYTHYHIKTNNLNEAAFYAKKYLKLGKIRRDLSVITDANKLLYQIYENKGEYLRAFEYLQDYNAYKDSVSIEEARNIVLKQELTLQQQNQNFEDNLKFLAYKQQQETELNLQKLKSEKSENQKKILFAGIFILSLLLFVFFRSIVQKKKDNELISQKAIEIEKQKELLLQQNDKLKADAILFNILRICSSDDLPIRKILNKIIDKLNDTDFLGLENKSAVLYYSKRKNKFSIDLERNITSEQRNKFIEYAKAQFKQNKKLDFKIKVIDEEIIGRYYFIPFIKNGRLLGFTFFKLKHNKKVSNYELRFLESIRMLYGDTLYRHKIADKLRLAHIENTIKKKEIQRAHKEVNKSLKQQEAINVLMKSIIKNENVGEKIFNYIAETLDDTFIGRLNVTLFDFETKMAKFYFLRENGIEKIKNKEFPLSDFSQETINSLLKNKRVVVQSIKNKQNKSESDLQMLRNNINSFASFPLFMNNKLLGSLNISFEGGIKFTEEQERFIQMLIEGVTIAIHQNILFNEISEKSNELSLLHQEISSSINYAKKLQSSILPSQDYIDEIFDEKFIFLKQRDVVGGDFYWVRQYENYRMIACIDCTGHSVPGAFMTMLSRVLLRESGTVKKLRKPNEILAQMDISVRRILRQTSFEGMQDGMDMSIVIINDENNEIMFSSAQRPMVIKFKNKDKLEAIKGSRFPVGGYYETEKIYELHTFNLSNVESFYLFTDGFTDQFGGDKIKKYGFKRFLNSLNLINGLPMLQQKEFLENEFKNWKGNLDQIDDVCVVGVKL